MYLGNLRVIYLTVFPRAHSRDPNQSTDINYKKTELSYD